MLRVCDLAWISVQKSTAASSETAFLRNEWIGSAVCMNELTLRLFSFPATLATLAETISDIVFVSNSKYDPVQSIDLL